MKNLEEIKTKKKELKTLVEELRQKKKDIVVYTRLTKALTELGMINWVLEEYEAL